MTDYDNIRVVDAHPIVMDGPELMTANFPMPEKYVGDWLAAGFTAMVYGKTGIGKSWFSIAVALAVAKGEEVLGWNVPTAQNVLYFDAEIDPAEMAERLFDLTAGDIPSEFKLCSGLRLDGGLPPFDEEEAHDFYLDLIEAHDIKVVVVDNLCSIVTGASISEDQTWLNVQPFLNELRRRRIAVILVHHAGKNGDYLGSSRMTQNMNTVIKLERPESHDPQAGAAFHIEFQKGRSLIGESAAGQTVRLEAGEGGKLGWEVISSAIGNPLEALVDALRSELYATQNELADALRVSQAKVSGMISKATRASLLGKDEAKETFARVKAQRRQAANENVEIESETGEAV